MSTAHTPGPWRIGDVAEIQLGTYASIQSDETFGDIVARVCVSHKANHTLNECGHANANLIAAAPELLEALEKVVATLPHIGGNERSVQGLLTIANKALSKAQGEA